MSLIRHHLFQGDLPRFAQLLHPILYLPPWYPRLQVSKWKTHLGRLPSLPASNLIVWWQHVTYLLVELMHVLWKHRKHKLFQHASTLASSSIVLLSFLKSVILLPLAFCCFLRHSANIWLGASDNLHLPGWLENYEESRGKPKDRKLFHWQQPRWKKRNAVLFRRQVIKLYRGSPGEVSQIERA